MFSLIIFVLAIVLTIVGCAWVLAKSAHWVGSTRGRFSIGLLATLGITAINWTLAAVSLALPSIKETNGVIAAGLFALVVEIAVIYLVPKYVFRLNPKTAFAPFLAYVVWAIVVIGFAFGILRPYMVEAFVMPTIGMKPTFEIGDRFVANKLLHSKRWDLVVYWQTNGRGDRVAYVKRLVGLPGERLHFLNGDIYVNDQRLVAPAAFAGQYTFHPYRKYPARATKKSNLSCSARTNVSSSVTTSTYHSTRATTARAKPLTSSVWST